MKRAAQSDEWVNNQFLISAPVAALLRFGAALHIDRRKRGEHVTSSSLLYALHKVDSDQAPQLLIDDPAASAFCAALRDIGEANASAMAQAWHDYDESLISLGVQILPQLPRISANIIRLIEEAATRAAAEQASAIGTAHLIDAILAQPTSRMKRRLVRAKIDLTKLEIRYREIVAGLRDRCANIIDTGWHPLANGTPPEWASGWGQDEYGVFTEITVEDVTQRLRWIPPGRFLMGSPADAKERDATEKPNIEITIAEGYWLFDTAVTQNLWMAVMGTAPSYFQGADLPVEQVRWSDALEFSSELSVLLPGLQLYLPSEAEWEYACRAGTKTPFAFGDKAEPRHIHFDSKGTIAVTAKPPNDWGLYQMHGNVWEWCADAWNEDHENAARDGAPRQGDSSPGGRYRVVRGGSWRDAEYSVHSARRSWHERREMLATVGFRCAARH